jgi:hypothetical protein
VTEWLRTVSGPKVNGLFVTFKVLPSITTVSGVPFVIRGQPRRSHCR